MRILFLTHGSTGSASSRVRIHQYLPLFDQEGIDYKVISGTSARLDQRVLQHPTAWIRLRWFAAKVGARLGVLAVIRRYDVVVIQRETLPYCYPFIELLICRLARRCVFEFDDAIFYDRHPRSGWRTWLRDGKNIARILARCDRAVVSTRYLADYARHYVRDVRIIPTTVDMERFPGRAPAAYDPPVIGWVGSRSTQPYVETIRTPLQQLAERYSFILRIVGGELAPWPGVALDNRPWQEDREVAEIQAFAVGLMPLPDDAWTRGKAGYKILLYMAAGTPAVASAVGANNDIINDGVDGFLAHDEQEWLDKLQRLLTDAELRRKMGLEARKTARERFSITANYPAWRDAWCQWPQGMDKL